ncbi:hypothetical protein IKS57_01155, partial [bacterium]|nr:hypothetical protein [bacterium]
MEKRKVKLISLLGTIGILAITSATIASIAYSENNKSNRSSNNSLQSNQRIANIITNYINNPIKIHSTLTANEALLANNVEETKSLILSTIKNELLNKEFNVDNKVYTGLDVYKNIRIKLPSVVSYENCINGEIYGVHLLYGSGKNTVTIKPKYASSYTVVGFSYPDITNSQTNNIVNKLDSILKQVINISGFTSITAADALINASSDSLVRAIISTIQTEISNNIKSFVIDGISYTASEITNNLTVTLPQAITQANDLDAQIPNVTLAYNGISLSTKLQDGTSTNDFIIEGFENISNKKDIGYNPTGKGTINNRNHKIASLIDSILKQVITISGFSSITAADALTNASSDNLVTAIISAIQTEISNNIKSFVIDGIAYSASEITNNLTVTLPQAITQKNDLDAQIPNVTLAYNGISLSTKLQDGTSTNDFIIEGFENISNK